MVAMPNHCGSVSPVPHPHQEQGDLWHNIMCVHSCLNSGRAKPSLVLRPSHVLQRFTRKIGKSGRSGDVMDAVWDAVS